MPSVFKALASIMVWILWICALLIGFGSLAMGIIRGDLFDTNRVPPMEYAAMFAVAGLYAILAAVIMWLRKKME